MKLDFLKFKKNKLPSLESLRPKIFNIDLFWFSSLGLFLIIFIITAFIGLNLFLPQYFEDYKQSGLTKDFENLINIDRLKNAINKRSDFINKEISLPEDPSI